MAAKVALINMKGGVGKSTLTANLAWQFACYTNWAKKVLVVDLDPQFNSSQYLLGPKKYQSLMDQGRRTIWDVFEQGVSTPAGGKSPIVQPADVIVNVVKFTSKGRIDLIPSRLELAWSLRNPAQKERKLANLIKKVEGDYDLILVDCSPTESMLTTAAYFTCDHVLVPVIPAYLSSIGLPLLTKSISEFEEQNDGEVVNVVGIVFNATDNYAPEEQKAKQEVHQFASTEGIPVFDSEVKYSRSYAKGAREGKPIFRTSYARTTVASEFHMFAREFAKKVGL
ncbi:ParA family protein [Burkholderia ubonensis]|uniref:ParA family protein n=1 Tax=Burkholderia ubonensis TaxID=101571 RepID=UPI0009B4581D|nr:ParA family protein [Burkholderia ubonensis]